MNPESGRDVGARPRPALTVIIPTLNESATLPLLLDDLDGLGVDAVEVIVADGGSEDNTRELALARGARVMHATRGRGHQLRAGAGAARAPLLCFLHADVRLDEAAREVLASLCTAGATSTSGASAPAAAWVFRLAVDAPGFAYRAIERGANLRTSLFALPYGDQGLVVARATYEAAGGYADVPLMEDVMIVRALKRYGHIALLPAALRVSPRRWERDGVWRRTSRNVVLLARHLLGAPPERLLAAYERE